VSSIDKAVKVYNEKTMIEKSPIKVKIEKTANLKVQKTKAAYKKESKDIYITR